MKKTLSLFAALLMSASVFSQEKIDIGANFTLGIPMGDYNLGNTVDDKIEAVSLVPGMGMGGNIEFNYWFTRRFTGGIEAGYIAFADEPFTDVDGNVINSSATAIPLGVKFDLFLSEKMVRPYFGLGVGYMLYTPVKSSEILVPGATDPVMFKQEWSQNAIWVSPRFGLQVNITDQIGINFNARYDWAINEIDGDLDVTSKLGDEESSTATVENAYAGPTSFVTATVGVKFTLFDYWGYW